MIGDDLSFEISKLGECRIPSPMSDVQFVSDSEHVIYHEELEEISSKTRRPLFSLRVYVLPSARYTLSIEETEKLGRYIEDALTSQVGLPLVSQNRHVETTGVIIRTRDEITPYGEPNTFLSESNVTVMPGVAPHMKILEGGLKIGLHSSVQKERVRDAVFRIAFPEREEAERYVNARIHKLIDFAKGVDPSRPVLNESAQARTYRDFILREAFVTGRDQLIRVEAEMYKSFAKTFDRIYQIED